MSSEIDIDNYIFIHKDRFYNKPQRSEVNVVLQHFITENYTVRTIDDSNENGYDNIDNKMLYHVKITGGENYHKIKQLVEKIVLTGKQYNTYVVVEIARERLIPPCIRKNCEIIHLPPREETNECETNECETKQGDISQIDGINESKINWTEFFFAIRQNKVNQFINLKFRDWTEFFNDEPEIKLQNELKYILDKPFTQEQIDNILKSMYNYKCNQLELVVVCDVNRLNYYWKKQEGYIPTNGLVDTQVDNKYLHVRTYLFNGEQDIQLPSVSFDDNKIISFNNGRYLFANLRDLNVKYIPIIIKERDEEVFKNYNLIL